MNSQGILFFDRMTEEVLDSIRADLKVSKPCLQKAGLIHTLKFTVHVCSGKFGYASRMITQLLYANFIFMLMETRQWYSNWIYVQL